MRPPVRPARFVSRLPLDRLRPLVSTGPRALLTGALALGAVVAGRVAGRAAGSARAARRPLPTLAGGVAGTMPLGRHRVAYTMRAGQGTPIVLLPGLSPVASTHELAPTWAHVVATTTRPVIAADWLGFGHSERPSIRYHAGLYQRQLRHLLTTVAREPADIVAWGLAAEVAAAVAVAAPSKVRRLALVAPSGMERGSEGSVVERLVMGLTGGFGAFSLLHARRTRRDAVRDYYTDEVFTTGADVPDDLVDDAHAMSKADGAAHAPRRLAEGLLFMDEYALRSYAAVSCPMLVVVPALTDAVAPHYDALPDLVAHTDDDLLVTRLDTGLLPQWEAPAALHTRLDAFLGGGDLPPDPVPPPASATRRAARKRAKVS